MKPSFSNRKTRPFAGLNMHSIQTRLMMVMGGMLLAILITNLFIFNETNRMVKQIDMVFDSNVTIGELTDALDRVETTVYEYLSTKSTSSLENYYRYSDNYRVLAGQLNDQNYDSELKMLEKNIRAMSVTYLAKADETVQAKRGRNVEQYKSSYEELEQLYRYINDYIYALNKKQFEVNSQNYEFLLSVMNGMEIISLAIVAVIFLICMVLSVGLIRQMFRPLTELAGAAHEVAAGNFEVELTPSESGDEIGVVSTAFSQMVMSIRAYILQFKENMENEAKMKERELSMEAHLKEAQLKFLQAQINPHFLFNSLNAGTQLAMMEEAESTGIFLERMADFFRYNVKKMNEDATLEEEIALVDNYIYILNVRFAGDITYEKRVDAPVDGIRVPSMILQPLVENAVTHGIRDMLDRGIIRLHIEQAEEGLAISVSDNGRGMSRAQIAAVMKGSADPSAENESQSTGIGVVNVISRMELYYEQNGLVEIHSEGAGLGTEIVLLIPAEKIGETDVPDFTGR